jgi:branched-chain amino acid transport system substrate-binding protein
VRLVRNAAAALALIALVAGCGSRRTATEIEAAAHIGSTSGPAAARTATQPNATTGAGADATQVAASPVDGDTGTLSAAGEAASAAGCAPGAPIRLGSVGTQSGIVGSSISGGVKALQAWVRWINSRGGINCHAVELTVADDGGDPARHQALVQQLVEEKGVIAFVHNTAPLSGQASISYLEQKRVPVIGEDGGAQWFYQSPMFFPQATAANPLLYTDLQVPASVAVPNGLTRLGSLTCQEAQYCTDADREWSGQSARDVGFEPVNRARASLAQPAFTAECLNAKNANVQTMIVVLDSNSMTRLARDCAAQGFKPTYTFAAGSVADRMKDDPNLDGSLIALQVAPWFATDLPAIAEYQEAMRAAGLTPDASSIIGWTSAKLFETVARNLSANPSSAEVLEGLWALQGETLGGLTYPLTYTRDANAAEVSCGFLIRIESRAFVAPNGTQMLCKP